MYPLGLMITPEPRLCSRRSRGMLKRPSPSSPKNWRKKGSICPPENWFGVRTTLDEEMLTTAGTTDFTTGAKPILLGPWFGSASFNDAGGFPANNFWLARATLNPAAPSATASPSARTLGFDHTL